MAKIYKKQMFRLNKLLLGLNIKPINFKYCEG